jgi:hypothetical protein
MSSDRVWAKAWAISRPLVDQETLFGSRGRFRSHDYRNRLSIVALPISS